MQDARSANVLLRKWHPLRSKDCKLLPQNPQTRGDNCKGDALGSEDMPNEESSDRWLYFRLLFLNGKRVRNMEKEAGYTVADY